MEKIALSIVLWLIRKYLPGKHLHDNPRKRPVVASEGYQVNIATASTEHGLNLIAKAKEEGNGTT